MIRKLGNVALVAASLVALGGLVVWTALSMEFVPTAAQIQARDDLRPFLIEPSNIEGVYANRDVDSAVFRYATTADEAAFWKQIEERSAGKKWAVVAPEGDVRRYQRVIPPVDGQAWWWVDEVRVRYQPDGRVVTVGWVQADPRAAVSGLSECSESKFAEQAIWPLVRGE